MRVSEAMTREVRVANPGQSIREVAKIMAEIDAGAMPVGDNDRLVGMITDRDIAIRAVALGKGPDTPVRDVMSTEQVLVILRLRWQIERLFRLWKEHGHIDQWRSKKPWRILCEVYAKLAAMVLQNWLIQLGCWQDAHRSFFKAAQVVRREANRLMVALYKGGLEEELVDILRCMRSGCRLNTRKQAPNTSQFLLGTPLVWPERQQQVRKA